MCKKTSNINYEVQNHIILVRNLNLKLPFLSITIYSNLKYNYKYVYILTL